MKKLLLTLLIVAGFLVKAKSQQSDYDSLLLVRNCVILDAKESIQEERDDLIYQWSFGDGAEAYGEMVEHCYDKIGDYGVILSVIDPESEVLFHDDYHFEISVSGEFSLSFVVSASGSGIVCQSKLNSRKKPKSVTYCWDFGDGHFGTGQVVSHQFDMPGQYNIRLYAEVAHDEGVEPLAQSKQVTIETN